VTDLRYRLYRGPVDLSPLVIRQMRQFSWEESRVTVYILGASHAVTVHLPSGQMVTELLTCLPPGTSRDDAQEDVREWSIPGFCGDSEEINFEESGLRGTIRLSRNALTPAAHAFHGVFASDNTLWEPFPAPTGETAWTRVAWRAEKDSLFLETIHTYPEDGAAVRSTTCLYLRTLEYDLFE
jgi:hypothetical protein